MKLLLLDELEERFVDQIRAVSNQVEIIQPQNSDELSRLLPETEAVIGVLEPDQFRLAGKLRWMHSAGAGVDGSLFPELRDSDVVFTSAKGFVGEHLADHAMALLLSLTRCIGWSVRARDWDEKWPIRNASWELTDRTMGIVGLGGTGRELAIRAAAFGMRIIAVDPEDVELPDAVEAWLAHGSL